MNTTMYNKIKELAAQDRAATTKKQHEEVSLAMTALQNENPAAYGEALERLISETSARVEELTIKEKMGEAAKVISMSYIAQKYFGKTRSWLSHKLNGDIVNGKPSAFTAEEMDTLKFAFSDISQMIGSLGAAL